MKLNKKLAELARNAGICEEWHDKLLATEDKRELVKMALAGIDFCLSNNYPPLPIIKKHFAGTMEPYGIYLDDQIAARNSEHVVAFGACAGAAHYTDFAVGQVFLKHTSKLTIVASGNAFVMVDIFDEAEVEVTATDNAKVCVNQYGGHVAATTDDGAGNAVVKVIRKQSKTY